MKIEDVCKNVSHNLNEDKELVHKIAMYQFQFIQDIMNDDTDTHDILINKLFRFQLKNRFKTNKQKDYTPHEKDN